MPEINNMKKQRAYDREILFNSFLEKARKVHGGKYTYHADSYVNSTTKTRITCPVHGDFFQVPPSHAVNKNGCPSCGFERSRKASTYSLEDFITKAKTVHGDKYDYSRVDYTRGLAKVEIICPFHASFWQTPTGHLSSRGCSRCKHEAISRAQTSNTESFIEKAKLIHTGDKYNYSNVNYKKAILPVIVTCKLHGDFSILPNSFLSGRGCQKCSPRRTPYTNEEYIETARKVHGDRYDYSLVNYVDAATKIKVICRQHGVFSTLPSSHSVSSTGCPACSESRGERAVSKILNSFNVKYIREYKIPGNKYRYDFYLPEHNVFIEYHGIQHYKYREFFHRTREEFLERKYIDKIKARLVKEYKGKLITLHYKQLDEGVLANSLIDQLKKLNIITSDQAQSALAISSEEEEEQASDSTSSLEHND